MSPVERRLGLLVAADSLGAGGDERDVVRPRRVRDREVPAEHHRLGHALVLDELHGSRFLRVAVLQNDEHHAAQGVGLHERRRGGRLVDGWRERRGASEKERQQRCDHEVPP